MQKRWLSTVRDTRVYRGAEFNNTDHRLLMAQLKFKIKNMVQTKKRRPDLEKLKDPKVPEQYQIALKNRFQTLVDEMEGKDVESLWSDFKETAKSTIMAVCGESDRKKDDWITPEVMAAVERKQEAFKDVLKQKKLSKETKSL